MFGAFSTFGKLGAMASSVARAWSPLSLWPDGIASPGMWIDPSYSASEFQASAGTTALSTVGTVLDSSNPVGLILDRKGGLVLGPELVQMPASCSGAFTSDATSVTRNGTTGAALFAPGVAGKTYQVSFTISGMTEDTIFVRAAGGVANSCTSNGAYTFRLLSVLDGYMQFAPWAGTNGTATITNISVREIPGLHLSQATSAARPVASARVNLLTYTEDFSNASWFGEFTKAANSEMAPDGSLSACKISCTALSYPQLKKTCYVSISAGLTFTYGIWIKRLSGDTRIGALEMYKAGALVASQAIQATTGWQFVSVSGTASGTTTIVDLLLAPSYNSGVTGEWAVWHPQMNYGLTALPYQRVGAASDYTATGFPVFAKFDGADDALSSATFSAGTLTSSMDCLIAVRRDSAANAVCGLYNAVADATKFFGMAESGSGSGCVGSGAGTPTVWVDGTQLTGGTAVTRATLHTALTAGAWHILELRGLDLSTWTAAGFGKYTSYMLNGVLGDIQLFASGQDANRDKARAQMAAYFGVTLP